ncbi:MAG: helix-turn-helix domain-containing protein [Erysipelotrichaceae bacterium]|nr:helix-turn-helix domain-containing protein [Erysipelotrichaceae bacterium]
MTEINENILSSWIRVMLAIDSQRLIKDMPFNEAVICNILYHGEKKMTATDLCEITGMKKSQMNRTLTAMEDKGMIKRERSLNDKRQIYISIDENNKDIYMKMHENTLKIVEKIASKLDKKELEEVIRVFNLVAEAAREETE